HDAVVNIGTPYRSDQGADIDPFIYKRALAQHSEIADVALGHEPLNNNHWGTDFRFAADTGELRVNMPRKYIDADYLDLYQIKLLAGRNLQQTDTTRDVIINDAARTAVGLTPAEAAVGPLVAMAVSNRYPIVGVGADFHQKALHVAIEPLALMTSNKRRSLHTSNIELPADRKQWKKAFAVMEAEWKA